MAPLPHEAKGSWQHILLGRHLGVGGTLGLELEGLVSEQNSMSCDAHPMHKETKRKVFANYDEHM